MHPGNESDDPGWGPLGPRLLLFLIPGYAIATSRGGRGTDADPLVVLRGVWLTFASAIVAFAVVLAFLEWDDPRPAGAWGLAVVGVGCACVTAAALSQRRALDCGGPEQLAVSYRRRFFLGIAFSEAAALFAFVVTFLAEHQWLYWCGAAFTFAGFALVAPTRGHLARDQEALASQGCGHQLVPALRLPFHRP